VTRAFGLIALLVSLAVGGYVFVASARKEGPTAPAVTKAEQQAVSVAASSNFEAAHVAMQAWYAENTTYADAALPPGSGVTLVRADATGYCLQTLAGSAVEHEVGPGGQPQPGPC
jgi:hypothetical protein